jgi:Tol biopolymer transport system component
VQVGSQFKGYTLGTTFTPDGEFLLYGLEDHADHPLGAFYRVPVLGGQPRKVIENVQSGVAVSTDGSRLAFVRERPSSGEEALIVCSSDGGDERTLVVKDSTGSFLFSGDMTPSWSPDDQLIAVSCATLGERWVVGILLVSVRDGTQSWLGVTDWEIVNRVFWHPGGTGLVAIGKRAGSASTQLWWVDYPEGSVRRITSDLVTYLSASIGITSDGRTLAAGQCEWNAALWQIDLGDPRGDARQVTPGERSTRLFNKGLDVHRDDRIIFSSIAAADNDIWLVRPDGTGRRQITAGAGDDIQCAVAAEGEWVVFASDRSGIYSLWTINLDGSGLRQVTRGEDYHPAISPDGRWVYFERYSGNRPSIWRVSIDGGEPESVIAMPSASATLSPDGAMLACLYQAAEGAPYRVAVLPVEGGEPRAMFDLKELWHASGADVSWSADGRGLIYVDQESGVYNLYLQPLAGGPPRRLTGFRSGVIFDFALAPDGRSAVCWRGSRISDVVIISDAQ